MRKVVIKEGIYNIKNKKPIRKVTLIFSADKITRELYIEGDTNSRNKKIDVIKSFSITFAEVNKLSPLEIGTRLKELSDGAFESNVSGELAFFKFPTTNETIT